MAHDQGNLLEPSARCGVNNGEGPSGRAARGKATGVQGLTAEAEAEAEAAVAARIPGKPYLRELAPGGAEDVCAGRIGIATFRTLDSLRQAI